MTSSLLCIDVAGIFKSFYCKMYHVVNNYALLTIIAQSKCKLQLNPRINNEITDWMLKREKKVSYKICQSKDACYKSFLKRYLKKMNSMSQYINTSRKQSDNS